MPVRRSLIIRCLTVAAVLTSAIVRAPAQVPVRGSDSAQAQSGPEVIETPRVAREIFANTMSPFCPGLTLAACPSPGADSLRDAIRDRVAAGESRESIEADLKSAFGDAVRGTPRSRGFESLAWIATPLLLLAVGIAIIVWARADIRRGRRVRQAREADTPPSLPDDPETARLISALDDEVRRG
jgi:cytochrome c-type biogenesis protein CcmH/NrfF